MSTTTQFLNRFIRKPSITLVLGERVGVCYLRTGLIFRKATDLIAPMATKPFTCGGSVPDLDYHPETYARNRFSQYVGAVTTALARTWHVGRIYLYGTKEEVNAVMQNLPPTLRAICIPRQEHTLRTFIMLLIERVRAGTRMRRREQQVLPFA